MRSETGLPPRAPRWFVAVRWASKSLLYGVAVAWLAFLPATRDLEVFLWCLVGLLWLTIMVSIIIGWSWRTQSAAHRSVHVSDLAMLLAPIPIFFDVPLITLALLVVGYVMQLSRISGGQVFIFALFGSTGALVLATIALVGVESADPNSQLSSPEAAMEYVAANLFRISALDVGKTVTPDGQLITAVVQVLGGLFFGVLFGGLLAWLVREQKPAPVSADLVDRMDQILKHHDHILRRLETLEGSRRHDNTGEVGDQPPSGG